MNIITIELAEQDARIVLRLIRAEETRARATNSLRSYWSHLAGHIAANIEEDIDAKHSNGRAADPAV